MDDATSLSCPEMEPEYPSYKRCTTGDRVCTVEIRRRSSGREVPWMLCQSWARFSCQSSCLRPLHVRYRKWLISRNRERLVGSDRRHRGVIMQPATRRPWRRCVFTLGSRHAVHLYRLWSKKNKLFNAAVWIGPYPSCLTHVLKWLSENCIHKQGQYLYESPSTCCYHRSLYMSFSGACDHRHHILYLNWAVLPCRVWPFSHSAFTGGELVVTDSFGGWSGCVCSPEQDVQQSSATLSFPLLSIRGS